MIERIAFGMKENSGVKMIKGKYQIDSKLLPLFDKDIYRRKKNNPKDIIIKQDDWDLFCDFVPDDYTKKDVLIAIMEELFKHLAIKTRLPLKLFFIIETQPKALNHVHYFIKSDYNKEKLLKFIDEKIDVLCLSNQYNIEFENDIKDNAVEYLLKGGKLNFKKAIILHSELIKKGLRKKRTI